MSLRHKFDSSRSVGQDFLVGKCEPFRIMQNVTVSDIVQYQLEARVFLSMYLLKHDVTQLQLRPDRGLKGVFLFFLENLLADVCKLQCAFWQTILLLFFGNSSPHSRHNLKGLTGGSYKIGDLETSLKRIYAV